MQRINPNSQNPLPSLGSTNSLASPAPRNGNLQIQGRHPAEHLFFTHPPPASSSPSVQSLVLHQRQEETSSIFRRPVTAVQTTGLQCNDPPSSPATASANKASDVANQILTEKAFEDSAGVVNAVKKGSLKDLEAFAELGYRFDTLFEDPETGTKKCNLLHIAASHGQHTLFKFLLNQGLDINALNDKNQTPLHCAINSEQTDPELIKKLLEEGADPNIANAFKKTPINCVLQTKKPSWMVYLLTSDRFDLKKNLNNSLTKTLQKVPLHFFKVFVDCIKQAPLSKEEEIQKIIQFQDFFLRGLIQKISDRSKLPDSTYDEAQKNLHYLLGIYFQAPHKNPLLTDSAGNTFLHHCVSLFASHFFLDICRFFNSHISAVQFKELIDKKNSEGNRALGIYLEKLIEQTHPPTLTEWRGFLELGFDLLSLNKEEDNCLHFFAKRKEFYNLCSLILQKEKLALPFCQKNQNGKSPYAIAKTQNAHIDFLKAHFSSDFGFKDPVHLCIQYGLDEALLDIVQKQQQILSPPLFENWINRSYEGIPFLIQCVRYRNLNALKVFMSFRAKWDIYDEDLRSLAYHMVKWNFVSGLQELVALAGAENGGYEVFFRLGLGKRHLIFDAIRLKKYDLVPLLFFEAGGYQAEDTEMATPIHALSYSPEDFHFLENLLKESKSRLLPEIFSQVINNPFLPDELPTPLEIATADNNFKTAALLFICGAKPPRDIAKIYQIATSNGQKDVYSHFFRGNFLAQLTGIKSIAYVIANKTVDYDSLPGAVFLNFLLISKEEKAKAQIGEPNYQKYVEKSFTQIGQMLKSIEENVFESIGAKKFGNGVKEKVKNALRNLYRATRDRQAALGTYNLIQDEYLHKQYYTEMVGCLSDIADALEKEPDPRSRALALLEIATPNMEGRCMGATREEILSAWRLLKQNEGENLSGFRNHLYTLLRNALNMQARLFAENIIARPDPSVPDEARAPGMQVHHYNQLLYLLGLTSVPEPKAICNFSETEIMGRFILHLGESDRWLIDPFLTMVKEKKLQTEMIAWIEDFIRKDLNSNLGFLQGKQRIKEFLQEADKKKFNAIFKELANKKQTEEVISFFQSYRSENLAPSVLVRAIQQRLQNLSSKKRVREEDLTPAENLRFSKRIRMRQGAENSEPLLEIDEKWKKILAAEKAWKESISEFALQEGIQYSFSRDESLEIAFFETKKSERLFSLGDDDCNITTEAAARYLLKHLKILRS